MRVFIAFLFSSICFSQSVRYATVSGAGSQDGTSEANAWSYAQAFSNAQTGMTVYMKAGTATGTYVISQSGTANSPIKFIGYVTTPGDVDEDAETPLTEGTITLQRPSARWIGDSPSGSIMPYISRSVASTGILINITGSFIHLYNFQLRGGQYGLLNSGSYNVIKNVYAFDQTDNSVSGGVGAPYFGFGVDNRGNNCEFKNIYVENAGAEAFPNRGDNNTFDNIAVYCDNTSNPTDYYFLFTKGTNNTSTDIYVYRWPGLAHDGHGITYKATRGNITGNTVGNFIIRNTYLEPSFPNTFDNFFSNGYLVNTESIYNRGGFRIANYAHDNTFDKIYLKNCVIKFCDWADGSTGDEPDGVANSAGYNNTFNQCIVDGGEYSVSFNFFNTSLLNGSAANNKFYNCTFYDNNFIFENTRANSGTVFENCVFDNIGGYQQSRSGGGYSVTATFTRCNFSNYGPANPSGTNITSFYDGSTPFANAAAGDFSVLASLQDIGNATAFLSAGNDLGATQPGGTLPPGDVTAPTVSGFQVVSTLETEIVVEWSLDEGGTGATDYDIDSGSPYANQSTTETSYLTYHRQTIRNLDPGVTYYFRVTGEDLAGNVYTSSEISATTLGTGTNPPGGVTASTRQKGDGVYLKTKKNQ